MTDLVDDDQQPLAEHFRAFIREPGFSCIGAKSTLAKEKLRILIARDIRSAWDDLRILPALHDFTQAYREQPDLFQSLAILFEGPGDLNEEQFEHHLWDRLQSLSDKDAWLGQPYDKQASADPTNPHFSLSFGGAAFFVVGLHPGASRAGRRFERPAMVFNLHAQFEQLREIGRYERLRETILKRDLALNGSANPVLARFGQSSEARQYSGRAVDGAWTCPFSRATASTQAVVTGNG